MDFRLPELGEGVYEAEMTRWLVSVGDQVTPGQGLLEVLTDKATMEVPSPFAGTITALKSEPGNVVKIGQAVMQYEPTDPAEKTSAPAAKSDNGKRSVSDTPVTSSLAVKAAPTVRQLARERGIDLASITGTGPEGRILMGDLPAPPPPPAEPANDFGRAGTRVKVQGLRRKIAEHMVQSTRTIPHFTYVDECDVTEMVRARVALRELYAQKGVKLTYLAFFIRAVALAIKEVPVVNSSLDESTDEIVMHDACNIGMAVGTAAGLIVPVIRDADKKSLLDIAREIQRLGDDARNTKSKLEDLRGGTFTVTSIGGIGGLFSSPIIHQPQVGILGIGKVVQRPVFDARGNVVPADIVYLSFSFDHRVLDGAVAAVFGNAIIKRLQKPLELAIEV